MEEKRNNTFWWIWGAVTLLAPLLLAWMLWDKLPEQIPIHWNIYGEADGFASKGRGIFMLSMINIVLYLLFWLLPKIDPKRNFDQFRTTYRWIIFAITTFISLISCLTILSSAGYAFPLFKMILTLVLLMLMIMGNFMGKLRPNYFVGIRTPWTIENDTVWTKTHRFAGRLWVFASALALIILFTFGMPSWLWLPYILTMALIPVAYSYVLYKQIRGND